jgi:hypothetical protein
MANSQSLISDERPELNPWQRQWFFISTPRQDQAPLFTSLLSRRNQRLKRSYSKARWSNLWKVPTRRRISHTYPVWLWGHSLFKISSPGPVLYGTKWLLWRPLN